MVRVLLTIWIVKLSVLVLRVFGQAHTHVPGIIAHAVHPGIIGAVRRPAIASLRPSTLCSHQRADSPKTLVGETRLVRLLTKGLVGVACSGAFEQLSTYRGRKAVVLNSDELGERL